jgi:hypothetical protein
MTCQECEIKLGMGEDAGEHLASCEECRWLAKELRLNSLALREMRVQPRMQWAWALAAAAAAIVIAILLSRTTAPKPIIATKTPIEEPPRKAAAAKIGRPTRMRPVRKKERTEPLRVKMFTSDPDVVIYWIVDRKEGSE